MLEMESGKRGWYWSCDLNSDRPGAQVENKKHKGPEKGPEIQKKQEEGSATRS